MKALIDKLKDPDYRRYGIEFYLLSIIAGSGTSTAGTINSIVHYLPFALPQAPLPAQWAFNCHILVKSGSVGLIVGSGFPSRLFIDGVEKATAQQIFPADGWRQMTRLYNLTPRQFVGYHNIFHDIYMTPATEFMLASPLIAPGAIAVAPDLYYGIVPSLEAWR